MAFSALAKQSASFVANLPEWIEAAVISNENALVELNISQMLNSTRADGKPILPLYSTAYAKKKGFTKPNLKVKGDFQDEMRLTTFGKQYSVTSSVDYAKHLEKLYTPKIFGIAPANRPAARELNDRSLAELYLKWLER